MKIVIDIPQGMIDAFSHEEQWTAVLCRDMNTVLQNSTPLEERPKGKWIIKHANGCNYYICSECNTLSNDWDNFCPNCGADMRGDV